MRNRPFFVGICGLYSHMRPFLKAYICDRQKFLIFVKLIHKRVPKITLTFITFLKLSSKNIWTDYSYSFWIFNITFLVSGMQKYVWIVKVISFKSWTFPSLGERSHGILAANIRTKKSPNFRESFRIMLEIFKKLVKINKKSRIILSLHQYVLCSLIYGICENSMGYLELSLTMELLIATFY